MDRDILDKMSHTELVEYIVDYYNGHFRDKVDVMPDDWLKDFIINHCN